MSRISHRFERLAAQQRTALITFMTAGFPDLATSQRVLETLAEGGSDVIELGMPFSDPVADGPTIQKAGHQALKNGQTVAKTLGMVQQFREAGYDTPIVLMGYCNPIYRYGIEAFLDDAKAAGADGLLIVDLPSEHRDMICQPARQRGLDFIPLTTPTTDAARLPAVLENTSGFIYYASMTGVTGGVAPDPADIEANVKRLKAASTMPVAVGFGVRTAEQVQAISQFSDGVIVGSALMEALAEAVTPEVGVAQVKALMGVLVEGGQ